MEKIISYVSNKELEKEFTKDVRMRNVNQKFFYLDEISAESYYKTTYKDRKHLKEKFTGQEYFKFLKNKINPKEKNVFISLGCGNSTPEKDTLKELFKNNFHLNYIGIDISKIMLDMAKNTLRDIRLKKKFVCVDFSEDTFIREIGNLTKEHNKKIAAFVGGTIGNVNQTNIADILFNVLSKGDLLWIEVLTRPDLSMESDMKIFNMYAAYLEDKDEVEFFFHPLKKIGIPFSSGKLNLKTTKEKSVGALLFTFCFTFKEKVVINTHNEIIHLLPDEEIELLGIRVYQPDTLISFFEEHGFTLIDRQAKGNYEQIMFKK